jgi:agmatine deiminase
MHAALRRARSLGMNTATLRVPHETECQTVIHTCWPAAADLWEEDLEPARDEFAAFLSAAGAPLTVYAATAEAEADARRRLKGRVKVLREAYGDVWARDTGPVFVASSTGLKAVRMGFNGWGGKYELAGDQTIGARIAAEAGAELIRADFTCEGGALEFDGQGTLITTRQCVLNANRNRSFTQADFEARAETLFGVTKVIWLEEGLVGDHTDGHVDNIARFAAPGVVVCQAPEGPGDPNAKILIQIRRELERATDAQGRRLKVVTIPSPGFVEGYEGEPAAASHMNWIVGPDTVVMPGYNDRAKDAARALQSAFAGRRVVARGSNAILTGGGSFHCVTCNQPAV